MKFGEQKDLLIIMPAYNEEQNITEVLNQLSAPEIKEIADVLVMNDASSDSTNWIVKKRGFKLVTNVFNLGYGSAIQLGYKYAIRRKYKYIIQMDSDGQHVGGEKPSIIKMSGHNRQQMCIHPYIM